jgi:predicted glycoside hydrolase/deacetylase ChbG (UPF0249 family)
LRRLVINADDFGLTNGVTAGIVEAMRRGVVSATTAMVCHPGVEENLRRWTLEVEGRVGLHLQLTDGEPCAEPSSVATLLDGAGRFPRHWRDLGRPDPEEVRREWNAQMERITGLGIRPTHLDTHHHVHRLPGVFAAFADIASAYGLPARALSPRMADALRARGVACADFCETSWPGGRYEPEAFRAAVERAFDLVGGRGAVELMCHPGYADEELARKSTYAAEREEELRALCDPRLRAVLEEAGVEVVAPCDLRAPVTSSQTLC